MFARIARFFGYERPIDTIRAVLHHSIYHYHEGKPEDAYRLRVIEGAYLAGRINIGEEQKLEGEFDVAHLPGSRTMWMMMHCIVPR